MNFGQSWTKLARATQLDEGAKKNKTSIETAQPANLYSFKSHFYISFLCNSA